MSPPKNSSAVEMEEPVWVGHENRIQRVETALGSSNVSLERVETNLENVTRTVAGGFEDLSRKMDKAFSQSESIESKMDTLVPRIEHLEKEHGARVSRKAVLRSTGGGLALAGAGAVVAKFGESIFVFLGNLFGK